MSIKKLEVIKTPTKLSFLGYLGDVQGCGTIRMIYPYLLLNHYRQNGIQVHTEMLNHYASDVGFYKNISFVQFQRSATEQHVSIFAHYKEKIQKITKTPVVYEIDDLLIGIPEWNFASAYYKDNEENVKKIMSWADGMICSTEPLKEMYSEYNKRIEVIPNHLPKFIWGDIYLKHHNEPREKRPRIFWGGSQNHFALKKMVKEGIKGGDFSGELLKFIRKTTDKYDWVFMGAMPEELNNIKNKITFIPWANVFSYPHVMKSIEPDICIAPLEDSVFNKCKSNIKMLEFAACGAPGVYSDVYPYRKTKLRAKTDAEMISHIELLAGDIDQRAKTYKKDREAVGTQLWWEEGNNLKNYLNAYLKLFGKRLPKKNGK